MALSKGNVGVKPNVFRNRVASTTRFPVSAAIWGWRRVAAPNNLKTVAGQENCRAGFPIPPRSVRMISGSDIGPGSAIQYSSESEGDQCPLHRVEMASVSVSMLTKLRRLSIAAKGRGMPLAASACRLAQLPLAFAPIIRGGRNDTAKMPASLKRRTWLSAARLERP